MKFLLVIFTTLFLTQSCQTKQEQNNSSKSLVSQCDELDIVYYAKDTFVYKTVDTSAIKIFKELITFNDEKLSDTCEPSGQLIYKNKGQETLIADLSIKNIKDSFFNRLRFRA